MLKEGTDTSQGKGQLISNINACEAVVDAVRSTLGPRGMDKLLYDGKKATISNDGATIMKLLDIVHPAAKTLVDISLSQDAEVGDGTTSVVLIGGELLKQAKSFVEDNMHPQIIVKSYRRACQLAVQKLKELQLSVSEADTKGRREMLERVAGTALNSKLISRHKAFFAPMVSWPIHEPTRLFSYHCLRFRWWMRSSVWTTTWISVWLERNACRVVPLVIHLW